MFALVLLTALPLVWCGMVSAISFIETPLKFRAPGMTRALGVGSGRIIFKMLNVVKAALAVRTIGAWTQTRYLVTLPLGSMLIVAVAG